MANIIIYENMLNLTFISVENIADEELVFKSEDGRLFKFYHAPCCCESVMIHDVIGDLSDLVGNPLLQAEAVSHENENPEGAPIKEYQDSFTWTFYKFATIKGSVTVRWYGESNGWYSESVDYAEIEG